MITYRTHIFAICRFDFLLGKLCLNPPTSLMVVMTPTHAIGHPIFPYRGDWPLPHGVAVHSVALSFHKWWSAYSCAEGTPHIAAVWASTYQTYSLSLSLSEEDQLVRYLGYWYTQGLGLGPGPGLRRACVYWYCAEKEYIQYNNLSDFDFIWTLLSW